MLRSFTRSLTSLHSPYLVFLKFLPCLEFWRHWEIVADMQTKTSPLARIFFYFNASQHITNHKRYITITIFYVLELWKYNKTYLLLLLYICWMLNSFLLSFLLLCNFLCNVLYADFLSKHSMHRHSVVCGVLKTTVLQRKARETDIGGGGLQDFSVSPSPFGTN